MTDHLESGHCVNFGEKSFRIHHGGSVCLLFILHSVVGVDGVFRFGPPLSSWGGFRSFDLLLFLFSLSYYFLLSYLYFSSYIFQGVLKSFLKSFFGSSLLFHQVAAESWLLHDYLMWSMCAYLDRLFDRASSVQFSLPTCSKMYLSVLHALDFVCEFGSRGTSGTYSDHVRVLA